MACLSDSIPVDNTRTLRRLGRFLTVGMLGTLIDVGLFTVLRVHFCLPALAANTTSYSAGIVNNYVLHRCWTFEGRSHKSIGRQFAQFAAISLSALVINNLLVLLLAPWLGERIGSPLYGDLLAKGYATGVGLCWNYIANNLWTFRDATTRGGATTCKTQI